LAHRTQEEFVFVQRVILIIDLSSPATDAKATISDLAAMLLENELRASGRLQSRSGRRHPQKYGPIRATAKELQQALITFDRLHTAKELGGNQ
jgi:hypothetical protein